MKNLGTEILVTQLQATHTALEDTMTGVTDEVAQFMPPGTANPIAGVYAHLVFSEDMFVHTFLMKTPTLFETTFKDNTGASKIQPTDWQTEYPIWLREVRLDVQKFRLYAKSVYEETEKYVATLSEADLEKEVDMSAFGMGNKKMYDFIANIINGHAYSIMGEIAVLKGIQGLKGYPF
ncbi:MAG: DinB family protein [Candidatus Woesebacteria bacterium]